METLAFFRFARAGAVAACLTVFAAAPAFAQQSDVEAAELSPSERRAIENVIEDYLLENPDLLMRVIRRLEDQQRTAEEEQRKEGLKRYAAELAEAENAPVLGNPEGDVVMVEFFDYNCGYCKRVMEDVRQTIENDGNIRLVMREFPILGDGSRVAARAALAAAKQDAYEEMHFALMGRGGKIDEMAVFTVAEELGLDIERLFKDMKAPEIEAHIEKSYEIARALGINGTPGFVIGEQVIPGAIPGAQMRAAVRQARRDSERLGDDAGQDGSEG